MTRNKRRPRLLIWRDAYQKDGWMEAVDDSDKRGLVFSIGFIVAQTKTHIHIAQSIGANDEGFSDVLAVPRKMIVKLR